MKAKITVNSDHSVTVERDEVLSGERVVHTYFVSALSGVGYVFYHTATGGTSQICEGMGITGSTLMASRESLPTVLRRELRKQANREKRDGLK